jgi:hypothetical protein
VQPISRLTAIAAKMTRLVAFTAAPLDRTPDLRRVCQAHTVTVLIRGRQFCFHDNVFVRDDIEPPGVQVAR